MEHGKLQRWENFNNTSKQDEDKIIHIFALQIVMEQKEKVGIGEPHSKKSSPTAHLVRGCFQGWTMKLEMKRWHHLQWVESLSRQYFKATHGEWNSKEKEQTVGLSNSISTAVVQSQQKIIKRYGRVFWPWCYHYCMPGEWLNRKVRSTYSYTSRLSIRLAWW